MFELRISNLLSRITPRRRERPRPATKQGSRRRPHAARRRHFRALALWTFAGVAAIELVLGAAIDVALPSVRDPEYAYHEQVLVDGLAKNKDKPLVMVLGSSHVFNGLDARMASQITGDRAFVFNFGIPSSGPFLEKIWLKRLKSRGVKPDVLFIEVLSYDYASASTRPDQRYLDGARFSLDELADIPATPSAFTGPAHRWAVGRLLPTYRHQAELRTMLGIDKPRQSPSLPRDWAGMDEYGWFPVPDGENNVSKQMVHRQYDDYYLHFKLSPVQVDLLEQNIASCQAQGIEAVLLLTPEGSEFRNLYSPEMTAAIDGMLARIHERFHVRVVDARDWVDDAGFFDMHHLTEIGAKTFTERLVREEIEPLLAAREQPAERRK